MKLLTPFIVALLVGIGIGIGAGIMMTKAKIGESETRIAELEAKAKELQEQNTLLKSSKDQSEQAIRKASSEMVRLKNGYQTVINQLNTNLAKTKAELAELKGTEPVQTITSQASTGTTTAPVGATVATTDYVVQEGDSLWKIAANELDNGMRFKEILKLNSDLSEDKPLVPGKTIKLPSQ